MPRSEIPGMIERRARGWTLDQLADRYGVTVATIKQVLLEYGRG